MTPQIDYASFHSLTYLGNSLLLLLWLFIFLLDECYLQIWNEYNPIPTHIHMGTRRLTLIWSPPWEIPPHRQDYYTRRSKRARNVPSGAWDLTDFLRAVFHSSPRHPLRSPPFLWSCFPLNQQHQQPQQQQQQLQIGDITHQQNAASRWPIWSSIDTKAADDEEGIPKCLVDTTLMRAFFNKFLIDETFKVINKL